ncbi:MAG: prolipoprotein diacylglyceryl transferase [Deltaproteobacteria bacterium]
MRPELIPHLLEFSVPTWKVILYVGSVVLGVYSGVTAYLREAKTVEARGRALWTTLLWAGGGIAATALFLVPNWLLPEAAKSGGLVNLPLHTYGIAIAVGFITAISYSAHEARRSGIIDGQSPPMTKEAGERAGNSIMDLAFYVLIAAIVGSRIMFILVNWGGPDGYAAHPENIFKFWTGGLVFYGGFLGSVGVSIWYARKHGINFLRLADIGMPAISIGHFFGRLGCLSAGCCFGRVVPPGFPLGLRFPPGSLAYDTLVNERHVLAASALATPALYPTQLFDSLGELLLFFFLVLALRPRKRYDGQVMLAWLFLYPLLRFTDELFRGDTERGVYTALHVSIGQLTSIGIALFAVVLFFVLHRRAEAQSPGVSQAAA